MDSRIKQQWKIRNRYAFETREGLGGIPLCGDTRENGGGRHRQQRKRVDSHGKPEYILKQELINNSNRSSE